VEKKMSENINNNLFLEFSQGIPVGALTSVEGDPTEEILYYPGFTTLGIGGMGEMVDHGEVVDNSNVNYRLSSHSPFDEIGNEEGDYCGGFFI
jgi:hypothetical protein